MSPKGKNKNQFYTSTNLENDLSNQNILNNVILTNPLLKTVKALATASSDAQAKSAALSVVGPFGSGKSTSVLVGYHYLRDTLPKPIKKALSTYKIPSLKKPFFKNEIKVITGVKKPLAAHLKQKLRIKNNLENAIQKRIQRKSKENNGFWVQCWKNEIFLVVNHISKPINNAQLVVATWGLAIN